VLFWSVQKSLQNEILPQQWQMIDVYMNKLAVPYGLMQTQKVWHLMH
jgi:hypothetical protein